MTSARAIVSLSIVAFAATGLGYVIAPSALLAVVDIDQTPTAAFLLRTEGVALIAAAGFLWATLGCDPTRQRVVLISLAAYYLLGSAVDLMAFREGIVGSLAAPSVVIRVVVGGLCLLAAARSSRSDDGDRLRSRR